MRGDHPTDQDAGPQIGEAVEPLHDVEPVRMGDHHQDQHGLVPDDSHEELPEERRVLPPDEEETHQATEEAQQVGHAQVGACPADPLHEERGGKHDDCQQHRIGDEHPQHEHQGGKGQSETEVPYDGGPDCGGHDHHGRPPCRVRSDPGPFPGRTPPAADPVGIVHGNPAHSLVAFWLIGPRLGRCRQPRKRSFHLSLTHAHRDRTSRSAGTVTTVSRISALTNEPERQTGDRRSTTKDRGTEMAAQSPGDSNTMTAVPASASTSLVVCSLEPWGTVRRRIRILVDELVGLDPSLRVLFVAPAVDIPHELKRGGLKELRGPRLEQVHPRIHVLGPRKWLPRFIGPFADRSLGRQVLHAVAQLGLDRPVLWVNDASYAQFSLRTGWPTLYDITDDWLLAPLAPRQRDRLMTDEALLLTRCKRSEQPVVGDVVQGRPSGPEAELCVGGVIHPQHGPVETELSDRMEDLPAERAVCERADEPG